MQDIDFLQQNSLDHLMASAREKYDVVFEPVRIGEMSLDILQIADMESYIDRLAEKSGEQVELPFWAKIWPASVLLGYYLCSLPAQKPLDMLELGAGVGVCGLAAAAMGHNVLITDNHPDALLFARINILRNNLQEKAAVQAVDFTADRLQRRFDCILGAEILYLEDTYPQLLNFLQQHLGIDKDCEIILSAKDSRKSPAFFNHASQKFQISRKTVKCRDNDPQDASAGENHSITIYRLRAQQH